MKKMIPALLLSGIPWAFLALYGDAVYGWGWPYLLMFVCMAVPALLCRDQGKVILAGSLLSFGVSLLLMYLFGFTGQNAYFKPFGALGWITALSLSSGLVQWLVWKREWLVLGLLTAVVGAFLGAAFWLQFGM